jgi:aryl-alcohol dehydrogenase-like predicted oxidoreductase
MPIAGKCTNVQTAAHAANFPHLTFRGQLPAGLLLSEVGFSGHGYQGDNEHHAAAWEQAVTAGINVINANDNYGLGETERPIGQELATAVAANRIQREALFLLTQAGRIRGALYNTVQKQRTSGKIYPNVVKISTGFDHCLHPKFLADALARSLDELGVTTVDGFLLQDPDFYLIWAEKAGIARQEARREYRRRLQEAFQYLEEEVSAGRIQYYGFSAQSAGIALETLTQAWPVAGPHLRLIQLPGNLLEPVFALQKIPPWNQTILEFAIENELLLLVARPINAATKTGWFRLRDVPLPTYPAPVEDVSTAVDESRELEELFQEEILPDLGFMAEEQRELMLQIGVGMMLEGKWAGIGTLQNLNDWQSQFILPRCQAALETLAAVENPPAVLQEWIDAYIEATNITLSALRAYYQERAAKRAARISEAARHAAEDWRGETLSQTAVRALRATDGVGVVLVAPHQPDYVEDILQDLARPVTPANHTRAWQQMQQAVTETV